MSDILGGPCPWLLLTLTLDDLLTHRLLIYTLTKEERPLSHLFLAFFIFRLTCALVLKLGNEEVKYDSGVLLDGMEPLTGLNLNGEFRTDINNKPDAIFQDVFKTHFSK